MAGGSSKPRESGNEGDAVVAVEPTVGNPDPQDPTRTRQAEDKPQKVKLTLSQHADMDAEGRTVHMGGQAPFEARKPGDEVEFSDKGIANAFIQAGFTTVDPTNAAEVAKVLGNG